METGQNNLRESYVRRLHTKILYLEACTFSLENAILLYEMNHIDFPELKRLSENQLQKIRKELEDCQVQ